MTQAELAAFTRRQTAPPTGQDRTGWSVPHYFAAIGVPILILQAWTTIAWLVDGPQQVTEFRTPYSTNWWAARVFEAAALLVSIAVIAYVVRGCRRERRLLTFDVMFCLCGATIIWNDIANNFFRPVFLVSSNFINLNNMCGNMPFVVNPDCGRTPDPVLFFWPVDTFVILGLAIVAAGLFQRARHRWPEMSTAKAVVMLLFGAMLFDLLLEIPAILLHLWTYTTAASSAFPIGGGQTRHAFGAVLEGGLGFGLLVAVRLFKDDKGRTFVERGLERHTPRARTSITLLALYGFFQIVIWIPGSMPMWINSFYGSPWPKLPGYLVNDVCDAPGVYGTEYGVCPGEPGYLMPGRGALDG